MKKILLCTTVLAGFATSAFAADMNAGEGLQVSVGGSAKFEGGYVKRNTDYKKRLTYSPNQKDSAFLTSNKVALKAEGKSDDITYGAIVRLQTVAAASNGQSESGMDRSHLFVNTNAGAVQMGTNFSASKLLAVDSDSVAAATGGVNGDAWSFFDIPKNSIVDSMVVSNIDTVANRIDSNGESYRKITYLSPEVSGVQLGLSFAPDAQNNGAENYDVLASERYLGRPVTVKNVVSGGLAFKHSMDDVTFKLSLTGDMGKTKSGSFVAPSTEYTLTDSKGNRSTIDISQYEGDYRNVKRNDLRSYAVGGMVEYQGFSFVLSYASDGKSLAPKGSSFRSSWMTAGLGYKNGQLSTSLTFLNGRKGNKNYDSSDVNDYPTVKTNAVSLGVDYAVLPGLNPFAEVTYAQVKPKRMPQNSDFNPNGDTKFKGTVFILGAKAKF